MQQRITKEMLERVVELLSNLSNKRYLLTSAYSRFRLEVSCNGVDTCDGISDISVPWTKPELYYLIQAIIQYTYAEHNDSYPNKTNKHYLPSNDPQETTTVHYYRSVE
ncbi:MAG: hypothetical protein ACYCQJ_05345 [Nitrososphaerales archaeon]